MTVTLHNGQIADNPSAPDDLIRVVVPNLTSERRQVYGPMAFDTEYGVMPERGDFALIAMDTDGDPWIVNWRRVPPVTQPEPEPEVEYPAAKGVRYTAFDVANAVPGTTTMPFESAPTGAAAFQQYESVEGMLDTSTGIITLPEDGLYEATAFFTNSAALVAGGTLIDITIFGDLFGIPGQRIAEVRIHPNGIAPIFTAHGEFAAESGDTIWLNIGQNTGATKNTGAGLATLPWYLAVHKFRELP